MPWALAAAAPLIVVIGLVLGHSVWAVYTVYHLGICLAAPAWLNRREGATWADHVRRLGLTGPGTRRSILIGAALGAAFLAGPLLAFALRPTWFPPADHLRTALANWGVSGTAVAPALMFLLLANGPAEELLWRGFLHDRLLARTWRPPRLLLLTALFTAYHTVTIGALAPDAAGRSLMLAAVFVVSLLWTESRRRWDSVWPALITHTAATAGYLIVCVRILSG